MDVTQLPDPGTLVKVPTADPRVDRPGDVVAAPVAPAKGDPLPVDSAGKIAASVVVPVKPWTQSQTILVNLGVFFIGVGDGLYNAVVPMIDELWTGKLQDRAAIGRALLRAALIGGYGAWQAWRRKRDNSVIGG